MDQGQQPGAREKRYSVVVVGDGIAASACRIALRRVPNLDVYRAAAPPPQDQRTPPVLVLWTNALAALAAIDRAAKSPGVDVSPYSFPLERLDIRGKHGELLWALPAGALGRRFGPTSHTEIAGTKTPQALQLEPRVTDATKFADALRTLGESPDAGTVSQACPGSPLTCDDGPKDPDLVILADGAGSKLRAVLQDRKGHHAWSEPSRDSGVVVFVGECGVAQSGLTADGVATATQGDGVRFGISQKPGTTERQVWYAFLRADALSEARRVSGACVLSPDQKAELVGVLRALHAPIADIARETKVINARPLQLRRPDERWHVELDRAPHAKQHVIVLGDAAHPMMPDLGQGCAMALEDVAVLRRELGRALEAKPRASDPLGEAIDAWEERRRPRVERVWRLSAAAAGLGSMHAPSLVRESVLRGPFAVTSLAVFEDLLGESVAD